MNGMTINFIAHPRESLFDHMDISRDIYGLREHWLMNVRLDVEMNWLDMDVPLDSFVHNSFGVSSRRCPICDSSSDYLQDEFEIEGKPQGCTQNRSNVYESNWLTFCGIGEFIL